MVADTHSQFWSARNWSVLIDLIPHEQFQFFSLPLSFSVWFAFILGNSLTTLSRLEREETKNKKLKMYCCFLEPLSKIIQNLDSVLPIL